MFLSFALPWQCVGRQSRSAGGISSTQGGLEDPDASGLAQARRVCRTPHGSSVRRAPSDRAAVRWPTAGDILHHPGCPQLTGTAEIELPAHALDWPRAHHVSEALLQDIAGLSPAEFVPRWEAWDAPLRSVYSPLGGQPTEWGARVAARVAASPGTPAAAMAMHVCCFGRCPNAIRHLLVATTEVLARPQRCTSSALTPGDEYRIAGAYSAKC